VLALPTYREGFPNVPLEAQAAGVPVVTTRVTGAVDSVLDGVTGKLVAAQDVSALAEALMELLGNPERRKRMGKVASAWVEHRFRRELVWEELVKDYRRILGRSGDREIEKALSAGEGEKDRGIGKSGDREIGQASSAGEGAHGPQG
jgi:glycosyltransferase involved in cell wall biosynthesis